MTEAEVVEAAQRLYLAKKRVEDAELELGATRDEYEAARVTLVPPMGEPTKKDNPDGPTANRILAVLEKEPARRFEIVDFIEPTKLHYAVLSGWLGRLARAGRIWVFKGKRYQYQANAKAAE
jgi:hypothetical protein